VRNRRDGSVEAVVHGTPETVAAMIELCRHGPPGAHVVSLEVSDEAEAPPDGFRILPTL
jgi:acylphosphatase